jgi:murein L,D-transpeptidase YafK
VIEKGRRKLTLVRVDHVVREFDIALGSNPIGPKQRSGDSRTPEGEYVVDFKNLYSNYYLSVRLSYPNARDIARAHKLGVDPGSNIMIHGMPNGVAWPYSGYVGQDWTNGCIAVTNAAMQEIWLAVRENTPVEIRPKQPAKRARRNAREICETQGLPAPDERSFPSFCDGVQGWRRRTARYCRHGRLSHDTSRRGSPARVA